jgi:hypothetical protein
MTSHQTGLRAAGAWLAGASLLLALALAFHGPLHPDLEVQMTRIAESASRWAAVHWTAAAAFSCFTVASVLVLVSGSRLTSTGRLISAWAVVLVGALWTLTTAVTEVTVIADLAASGDLPQFEAWWSFAEGYGNGFSLLAVAVSVIAWSETRDPQRLVPKWSAAVGAGAGLASFTGWSLGVWFDIGPANLLWVLASGVMCVWLAWLGTALARTSESGGSGART